MRLRKKSETIEAVQYDGDNAQEIIDFVGDGPGAYGGKVIVSKQGDDLIISDELKPGKFLNGKIEISDWVFRRFEEKHGRTGMDRTIGDIISPSKEWVGMFDDKYIKGFYEPATYE